MTGERGAPPRRSFWRVAATPRMLGLLLAFLAAAGVCGALGAWQLDRAQERGQLAAAHKQAEQRAGGPQPLATVLRPQQPFPSGIVGRSVTVSGEYLPGSQLYVPGRSVAGKTGYLVLAGLRVTDDGSDGASWAGLAGPPVLPIVRGWSADLAAAKQVDLPTGTVRLSAYLQSSEASGTAVAADDTVQAISSAQLLGRWGGPIYSGYAVLSSSTPHKTDGLVPLPRPTVEGGSGWNIQSLFYALEWWVFAGFAVALWLRMVRDKRDGEVDLLALPAAG